MSESEPAGDPGDSQLQDGNSSPRTRAGHSTGSHRVGDGSFCRGVAMSKGDEQCSPPQGWVSWIFPIMIRKERSRVG